MTNQQHPITPPPELVQQWWAQETYDPFGVAVSNLATQAAQWGSDQELEACCKWLDKHLAYENNVTDNLRTARRSKPPSLKEQALEAMGRCDSEMWCEEMEIDLAIIRTALESLPS